MSNELLKLESNFICPQNSRFHEDGIIYIVYAMYIICVPRNKHIEDLKVRDSVQLQFEKTDWCREFENCTNLQELIESFK